MNILKLLLKQINQHSDVRKLSIYLMQWRGGGGEAWASEALPPLPLQTLLQM